MSRKSLSDFSGSSDVQGETAALTSHTSPWASSAELLGIHAPSPLTSGRPENTRQQTTTCQWTAVQVYPRARESHRSADDELCVSECL